MTKFCLSFFPFCVNITYASYACLALSMSLRAICPKGGVNMQNNYETIIIINSNLEEAQIKDTVTKVTDLISANGKLESTEEWGKKRLAYPIAKQNEGYYVLINFSSNPDFIEELERVYNITDEVIKHIIVKK